MSRNAIPLDKARELEEAAEGDFLSSAEKHQWADEQRPFYITSVEFRDGQFGAEIVYELDDEVLARRLSLATNIKRAREARSMQAALSEGDVLGPVQLAKEAMKNGKSTWAFHAVVFQDGAALQDQIPF